MDSVAYQRMDVLLRVFCLLLINGVGYSDAASPRKTDDQMIAIVQNRPGRSVDDYIHIIDPPTILSHNAPLVIDYMCSKESRAGVEVRIWTEKQPNLMIFQDTWTCSVHAPEVTSRKRVVNVRLPPRLAYRSGPLNKDPIVSKKTILRVWIVENSSTQKGHSAYSLFQEATVKAVYETAVLPPTERPDKALDICYSWLFEIRKKMPYIPKCPVEKEVLVGVSFPVALSGGGHGVHRFLKPFRNKRLEQQRRQKLRHPRFTIVTWLYIKDYCLDVSGWCTVFQHITWDDFFLTPVIFITNQGYLYVQVVTVDGQAVSVYSTFTTPKNEWCRLVVSFDNNKLKLTLNFGMNLTRARHTVYSIPKSNLIWFDDTQGLFVFGGSEMMASFQGYIGQALLYRRKALSPHQVASFDPYLPMFELGIGEQDRTCQKHMSWVTQRIYQAKNLLKVIIEKRTCSNSYENVFLLSKPTNSPPQCRVYRGPKPKEYRLLNRIVRQMVIAGKNTSLVDIGTALYENVSATLDEAGIASVRTIIHLLEQSSCFGNHDSTFMMSTILSNGIQVKAHTLRADSYLMRCALDNNRLCLLTLGNKHAYGLDGIPSDDQQAYVYYKNMAEQTLADRDKHKPSDVYPESVRLTDEESIQSQTDEKGDIFLWLQHQAGKGVVTAQQEMARMLYWGSKGVKRNLESAAQYYRMSAESNDPSAAFDYGLVLLKGKGVKRDMTEAVKHLSHSAKKGNPQALNALGWHALEVEKNNSKALELFQDSYNMGNADAAYNLGHMYLTGTHPSGKIDRMSAINYFAEAALKGQLESGLMVAVYNTRGNLNGPPDPKIGLAWARYVSEQNPATGLLMAKGLKSYRNKKWSPALLYYMLASETGLETATFNVAFLCEENADGVVSYIEKECVWKNYNLSTQREAQYVDPYAWLKMGDYYWYGCRGERDTARAARMYGMAAQKGDPQALFNLAFLIEEGVPIPVKTLRKLNISEAMMNDNITLRIEFYTRCQESRLSEAYVPCSMALLGLNLNQFLLRYQIVIKVLKIVIYLIVVALSCVYLGKRLLENRLSINML